LLPDHVLTPALRCVSFFPGNVQATYFGKGAGFTPVVHSALFLMVIGYAFEYPHLGASRPHFALSRALSLSGCGSGCGPGTHCSRGRTGDPLISFAPSLPFVCGVLDVTRNIRGAVCWATVPALCLHTPNRSVSTCWCVRCDPAARSHQAMPHPCSQPRTRGSPSTTEHARIHTPYTRVEGGDCTLGQYALKPNL
jgi:hypothetical protein